MLQISFQEGTSTFIYLGNLFLWSLTSLCILTAHSVHKDIICSINLNGVCPVVATKHIKSHNSLSFQNMRSLFQQCGAG